MIQTQEHQLWLDMMARSVYYLETLDLKLAKVTIYIRLWDVSLCNEWAFSVW